MKKNNPYATMDIKPIKAQKKPKDGAKSTIITAPADLRVKVKK